MPSVTLLLILYNIEGKVRRKGIQGAEERLMETQLKPTHVEVQATSLLPLPDLSSCRLKGGERHSSAERGHGEASG